MGKLLKLIIFDFLLYLQVLIISFILLVFIYKYVLILLILLELVVINISLLMFLSIRYINIEFYLVYYLVFRVCEGVLGLGLLVLLIRFYGDSLYYIFNFSKF